MAKTFILKILTPENTLVSEEVEKEITKSQTGNIEFLYGHEPMIVSTVSCITRFVDSNGVEKKLFTSKGVVNVQREEVVFCLDAAEFPEDIDLERAKNAKERAEKKLKEGTFENKEIVIGCLERANLRINLKNTSNK